MQLTLNGDGVAAFTARTYSRSRCGGVKPTPMEPTPPALLPAMARSGVRPAKARPAQAKRWRTAKRSVKRVAIDGMGGDIVVSLETGVDAMVPRGRTPRQAAAAHPMRRTRSKQHHGGVQAWQR